MILVNIHENQSKNMDEKMMKVYRKTQAVKHFKEKYSHYKSGSKFSEIGPKVDGNIFHQALVKGDKHLVEEILRCLSDSSIKEFALNSCVNVGCHLDHKVGGAANKRKVFLSDATETGTTDGQCLVDPTVLDNIQCEQIFDDCDFELPIALAATANDRDLIALMVKNGANIFAEDSEGNNVIHLLVYWSKSHPKEAVNMYQYILTELLSTPAERWRLVRKENIAKLTPLDLASMMWQPEMLLEILNTEDVYKIEAKSCITHRHVLYDVSDYEGPKGKRSPLNYIKGIDVKTVLRFEQCQFFKKDPIAPWIEARRRSSNFSLRLWIAMWALLIGLYTTQFVYFCMALSPPLPLNVIICCFGTFGFINEIVVSTYTLKEMFHTIKQRSVHKTQGFPAVFTYGYRIFFPAFALDIIASSTLHILYNLCEAELAFRIVHFIAQNHGLWTLLFFTQLNKEAGHLLVMIQRMLYDFLIFMSVAFIIYFGFSNSFYILNMSSSCSVSLNSTYSSIPSTGYVSHFTSFSKTMLNTFLLSLSIAAPGSETFGEENVIQGLSLAGYIGCVLFMSILLVNLLIGIMSQRVTEISEKRDTFLKLEAISILEFSHSAHIQWIVNLGKAKDVFHTSSDGSQVYLEMVEKATGHY